MNYNNLVALTSIALMSGYLDAAAQVRQYTPVPASLQNVNAPNGCNMSTAPEALDCFHAHNLMPVGSPLSTKKGFTQVKNHLSLALTSPGLISFTDVIWQKVPNMARKLSSSSLENALRLYTPNAGFSNKVNNEQMLANHHIRWILVNSSPDSWTKSMNAAHVYAILNSSSFRWNFKYPLGSINKMKSDVAEHHGKTLVRILRAQGQFGFINRSILKAILKDQNARNELNRDDFVAIIRNPDLAKVFTGSVFAKLNNDIKGAATPGRFVRNLPSDVFSEANYYLATDFYRYASESQIKNWQSKNIKTATDCFLRPHLMQPKFMGSVSVKVWMKFFEQFATWQKQGQAWVQLEKDLMAKWYFWKRLPTKVFKDLIKDHNLVTLLPHEAFKAMTKEQRQLILNAGDKDTNATSCTGLPNKILKGKKSRYTGLKVSNACIKAKVAEVATNPNAAEFIARALVHGMVEPSAMKKLDKPVIDLLKVKIKRPAKVDDQGKKEKRDPREFERLLAFEALQKLPNGADYVKAFMNPKEDQVLKDVCKDVTQEGLKKAKWLQTLLSRKCVKQIEFDSLDDAKKLHPNIWENMSGKQLKKFIDRSDLKALEGPFMAGLAANKDFARMSCKKKTKENSDGDDVERKSLMVLVKSGERSKYFGHKYVSNLPDTDDCKSLLTANVASFADDALAGADNAWVVAHSDLLKVIRDEQYGHISDEVKENSYPASLQPGSVSTISTSRCANLSVHFVSKMTASSLAAFSADQLKAIPAASFALVCGDKQVAFKHSLTDEQKASLGKDCPNKTGSMAPSNAHIGAFAAVVAAAAGSLALLL